jgi:hypothetical protein
MLYNIILSVIISIIIIIVLHYLFLFFKDTLTVPIVKDMIIKPSQTYKHLETISNNLNESPNSTNSTNSTNLNDLSDSTNLNNLSDANNMRLELKHYLNDLNYTANNVDIKLDSQLNSKLYSEIR